MRSASRSSRTAGDWPAGPKRAASSSWRSSSGRNRFSPTRLRALRTAARRRGGGGCRDDHAGGAARGPRVGPGDRGGRRVERAGASWRRRHDAHRACASPFRRARRDGSRAGAQHARADGRSRRDPAGGQHLHAPPVLQPQRRVPGGRAIPVSASRGAALAGGGPRSSRLVPPCLGGSSAAIFSPDSSPRAPRLRRARSLARPGNQRRDRRRQSRRVVCASRRRVPPSRAVASSAAFVPPRVRSTGSSVGTGACIAMSLAESRRAACAAADWWMRSRRDSISRGSTPAAGWRTGVPRSSSARACG